MTVQDGPKTPSEAFQIVTRSGTPRLEAGWPEGAPGGLQKTSGSPLGGLRKAWKTSVRLPEALHGGASAKRAEENGEHIS
eukprot:3545332-Pyramimonas_sp.AAC.1